MDHIKKVTVGTVGQDDAEGERRVLPKEQHQPHPPQEPALSPIMIIIVIIRLVNNPPKKQKRKEPNVIPRHLWSIMFRLNQSPHADVAHRIRAQVEVWSNEVVAMVPVRLCVSVCVKQSVCLKKEEAKVSGDYRTRSTKTSRRKENWSLHSSSVEQSHTWMLTHTRRSSCHRAFRCSTLTFTKRRKGKHLDGKNHFYHQDASVLK